MDLPQTEVKYVTEVVEVINDAGIISIHADLLRVEEYYDTNKEGWPEVMTMTLGESGTGAGVIFTENTTYDIKFHGEYSWITDNSLRPEKPYD